MSKKFVNFFMSPRANSIRTLGADLCQNFIDYNQALLKIYVFVTLVPVFGKRVGNNEIYFEIENVMYF